MVNIQKTKITTKQLPCIDCICIAVCNAKMNSDKSDVIDLMLSCKSLFTWVIMHSSTTKLNCDCYNFIREFYRKLITNEQ